MDMPICKQQPQSPHCFSVKQLAKMSSHSTARLLSQTECCLFNCESITACSTAARQLHLTTQRPLTPLLLCPAILMLIINFSLELFNGPVLFHTEKVDYMHYSHSNMVVLLQSPPHPSALHHINPHTHSPSPRSDEICTYCLQPHKLRMQTQT